MSEQECEAHRQAQMAETVRLVVSHRERAPRSPRMERALKQLIRRYHERLRIARESGSPTMKGCHPDDAPG